MRDKIKNRRLELGLTLEQVGDMCGVGKSTVRKWENGMINEIGRSKIVLLSKALQVSPLFILEEDDDALTAQEMRMLKYYRLLNETGMKRALNNVQDLTQIKAYSNIEEDNEEDNEEDSIEINFSSRQEKNIEK